MALLRQNNSISSLLLSRRTHNHFSCRKHNASRKTSRPSRRTFHKTALALILTPITNRIEALQGADQDKTVPSQIHRELVLQGHLSDPGFTDIQRITSASAQLAVLGKLNEFRQKIESVPSGSTERQRFTDLFVHQSTDLICSHQPLDWGLFYSACEELSRNQKLADATRKRSSFYSNAASIGSLALSFSKRVPQAAPAALSIAGLAYSIGGEKGAKAIEHLPRSKNEIDRVFETIAREADRRIMARKEHLPPKSGEKRVFTLSEVEKYGMLRDPFSAPRAIKQTGMRINRKPKEMLDQLPQKISEPVKKTLNGVKEGRLTEDEAEVIVAQAIEEFNKLNRLNREQLKTLTAEIKKITDAQEKIRQEAILAKKQEKFYNETQSAIYLTGFLMEKVFKNPELAEDFTFMATGMLNLSRSIELAAVGAAGGFGIAAAAVSLVSGIMSRKKKNGFNKAVMNALNAIRKDIFELKKILVEGLNALQRQNSVIIERIGIVLDEIIELKQISQRHYEIVETQLAIIKSKLSWIARDNEKRARQDDEKDFQNAIKKINRGLEGIEETSDANAAHLDRT